MDVCEKSAPSAANSNSKDPESEQPGMCMRQTVGEEEKVRWERTQIMQGLADHCKDFYIDPEGMVLSTDVT